MEQMHVQLGETLMFGRYPQTRDGEERPIAWRVLDVRDGRALLLSEYVLDMQPFTTGEQSHFWGFSFLRGWLEDTFLPRAFTPQEALRLRRPERIPTEDAEFVWQVMGGDDATDHVSDTVFVLSVPDVMQYFPGEVRGGFAIYCPGASAQGTEWAREMGYQAEDGMYWLRSSTEQMICMVSPEDSVGWCFQPDISYGVRPALWLELAPEEPPQF